MKEEVIRRMEQVKVKMIRAERLTSKWLLVKSVLEAACKTKLVSFPQGNGALKHLRGIIRYLRMACNGD